MVDELLSKHYEVVVVNDGSPSEFDMVFSCLNKKVHLLKNAINLGKGASLKYGLNYILTTFSSLTCIITLDCDGQHSIEDVCKLKQAFLTNDNLDLVLGVRTFEGKIPLRSSFGNKTTRLLFQTMFGTNIQDTQSGLRLLSPSFARTMLRNPYNGYEFEMQMLIESCNKGLRILQVPIQAIYINNNASSHFNPIFDSLSIYFVLFRHIGNSLLTALIDYVVFVISFTLGASLLVCMVSGRIVAGSFNFIVGKHFVFKTKANLKFELISYTILTIVLMCISMQGIAFISHYSGISEVIIKPICELTIFAISFLVQRFFIFTSKAEILDSTDKSDGGATKTDWEKYYQNRQKNHKTHLPAISHFTRKISQAMILKLLEPYSHIRSICEFGGGGSCFYEGFRAKYQNATYIVLDSSIQGVESFNNSYGANPLSKAIVCDILHTDFSAQQSSKDSPQILSNFDLVFSVGLIEHFNQKQTRQICLQHFNALKSGGILLITYPTPTLLYRIIRGVLERLGKWEFYDERPLYFEEVDSVCKDFGKLCARKLNAYIGLTQEILVYQKY